MELHQILAAILGLVFVVLITVAVTGTILHYARNGERRDMEELSDKLLDLLTRLNRVAIIEQECVYLSQRVGRNVLFDFNQNLFRVGPKTLSRALVQKWMQEDGIDHFRTYPEILAMNEAVDPDPIMATGYQSTHMTMAARLPNAAAAVNIII